MNFRSLLLSLVLFSSLSVSLYSQTVTTGKAPKSINPTVRVVANLALGTLLSGPANANTPPFDSLTAFMILNQDDNIIEANTGLWTTAIQCCPEAKDCPPNRTCPCYHSAVEQISGGDTSSGAIGQKKEENYLFLFFVRNDMIMNFRTLDGQRINTWTRKRNFHGAKFDLVLLNSRDLPAGSDFYWDFSLRTRLQKIIGGKRRYRFLTSFAKGVLKPESEAQF